jgi:hypothetical protein
MLLGRLQPHEKVPQANLLKSYVLIAKGQPDSCFSTGWSDGVQHHLEPRVFAGQVGGCVS